MYFQLHYWFIVLNRCPHALILKARLLVSGVTLWRLPLKKRGEGRRLQNWGAWKKRAVRRVHGGPTSAEENRNSEKLVLKRQIKAKKNKVRHQGKKYELKNPNIIFISTLFLWKNYGEIRHFTNLSHQKQLQFFFKLFFLRTVKWIWFNKISRYWCKQTKIFVLVIINFLCSGQNWPIIKWVNFDPNTM